MSVESSSRATLNWHKLVARKVTSHFCPVRDCSALDIFSSNVAQATLYPNRAVTLTRLQGRSAAAAGDSVLLTARQKPLMAWGPQVWGLWGDARAPGSRGDRGAHLPAPGQACGLQARDLRWGDLWGHRAQPARGEAAEMT